MVYIKVFDNLISDIKVKTFLCTLAGNTIIRILRSRNKVLPKCVNIWNGFSHDNFANTLLWHVWFSQGNDDIVQPKEKRAGQRKIGYHF